MQMGDWDGDGDGDEVLLRVCSVLRVLRCSRWNLGCPSAQGLLLICQDERRPARLLLSLSLFRSHCLACTLAGLMKYLLTALFDQLATGLLMSRALHQASGGGAAGRGCTTLNAAKIFAEQTPLYVCVHVCVCALCSYFIYVYVQKSIRSETVRAGYEKSFYAFFPATKSIFKLFPPPMLDAWAHLFAIIWSVRTWYPCLPARTQEILKRNSIWVARVCPASSGSHRRNTRPIDIDAICDKWPHMNNKSCDWCAVSRNTLTAF